MDNTSFAPGNNSINNSVPPPAPQYSVPEPKHFLNKKFIIVFVTLILLGGSAYAGISYWGNQQVAQKVVPTFTPRASVGFKTYTSVNGYSFNYPENWAVSEEGAGSMTVTSQNNKPWEVSLGLSPITNTLTLDFYEKQFEQSKMFSNATKIIFAGESAWEGIDGGMTRSYSILVAHNKLMYRILVFAENKDQLSVEQKQILSTFKFTPSTSSGQADSADTSTWKTYTNTQYGFEFKYPATWRVVPDVNSIVKLTDYMGTGATDVSHNFVVIQADKSTAQGNTTKVAGLDVKIKDWHAPEMGTGLTKDIYIPTNPQLHVTILALDKNTETLTDQILSTFKFTK